MSGSRPGLKQLLAYYGSVVPPNWLAHVSTGDDLEGVLRRAEEKGVGVPSIEQASRAIANGDSTFFAERDSASSADDVAGSSPAIASNFRYSTRVVHWDDLHADGDYGSKLSFGNYGSVWINDEYRVAIENAKSGCAVLAAYAPSSRLGGLLVLPHILDMKSKRTHHLAQEGADPDSPLFELKGNNSVFHLQARVANMIGAQQCLYCLEMYKFIKGFAKHEIGMGEMQAALLFIDGTQSSQTKYGTPPPQIQQFLGAALMLGIRVSKVQMVSASSWSDGDPLAFDPAVPGLMLGNKVLFDLTSDHVIEIRPKLKIITRFRDELPKLVRSSVLRERIWTYHVPMAIATSYGSTHSLAARFRSIRVAAKKYPQMADLEPWLGSTYARWQEEVPKIV